MNSRTLIVTFLVFSLVWSMTNMVLGGPLFEPVSPPIPWTVDVSNRKQVFLDDMLITDVHRITKIQGEIQKYAGNPIIVADQAWEKAVKSPIKGAQLEGQAVIYDEADKVFKMWYFTQGSWPGGEQPLGYAISQDGYHWEKPSLGVIEFEGSKKNNMVWAGTGFTIINVIKTPNDPDPKRLYKASGEIEGAKGRPSGTGVAFSPDGLHWTVYEKTVVPKGPDVADASAILGWDPRIEKYVAYYRPAFPLNPEILLPGPGSPVRTVGYSESDDFINWTPTRVMIMPDHKSRTDEQYQGFGAAYDEQTQMYIGLLPLHMTHEQIWDTYLLSSRDGFNWTWIDRNKPFIGRGQIGTYDDGYQWASGPILHDGTVFIYYGAFQGAHSMDGSSKRGPFRLTIALATIPMDRYAGLLAGGNIGTVTTRALTFKGSKLMVDIEAGFGMIDRGPDKRHKPSHGFWNEGGYDECEVRVAILNQRGKPLPGYSFEECNPLLVSGVQEITWTSGKTINDLPEEKSWYINNPAMKPLRLGAQDDYRTFKTWRRVRLAFKMRNAALYSFQFKD